MTNADLRLLIELRFAVYQVGCEHGLWSNISENAAEEYMKIVFPKSSNLAFFNLMTNVAHKKQGETFFLTTMGYSTVLYRLRKLWPHSLRRNSPTVFLHSRTLSTLFIHWQRFLRTMQLHPSTLDSLPMILTAS